MMERQALAEVTDVFQHYTEHPNLIPRTFTVLKHGQKWTNSKSIAMEES